MYMATRPIEWQRAAVRTAEQFADRLREIPMSARNAARARCRPLASLAERGDLIEVIRHIARRSSRRLVLLQNSAESFILYAPRPAEVLPSALAPGHFLRCALLGAFGRRRLRSAAFAHGFEQPVKSLPNREPSLIELLDHGPVASVVLNVLLVFGLPARA